jgi:hypothetical protein
MTLLIIDGSGNPTNSNGVTAAQAKTLIDSALTASVPPIRIELRNS